MRPTWSQLGPTWANLEPTWTNLGPTWGQLGAKWGPTWASLGATWDQLTQESTRTANQESRKTRKQLRDFEGCSKRLFRNPGRRDSRRDYNLSTPTSHGGKSFNFRPGTQNECACWNSTFSVQAIKSVRNHENVEFQQAQ